MSNITEGLIESNSTFQEAEKKLAELASRKKGETVSVESVITDCWTMIINGLPYVKPVLRAEYMISQARDLRALINKSGNPCSWDRIRKLLDFDVMLKDKSLEAKEGFIRPHNLNVARYAKEVCRAMGYRPETTEQIAFSGELHDIGKIGIPDHILNKPGKLTAEEFELVKPHPLIGANILNVLSELFNIQLNRTISEVELHHEKYYGGGYPYNKKGDDIPIGAQIITICDVFDAMTSSRPYCGPICMDDAIKEMQKNEMGCFNPELLEYALRPLEKAYHELQGK